MTFEQVLQVIAKFEQAIFQEDGVRPYISDFDMGGDGHLVVYTTDKIGELTRPNREELYQLIISKWQASQNVAEFDLPTWIEVYVGDTSSTIRGNQSRRVEPEIDLTFSDDFREWNSANGKFRREARIVSYTNGILTLEYRNGKRGKVLLEKLSKADREFISLWRKAR